ncbi:hypothetical protein BG000_004126 [Podila horticola]|nr:hypothetical protein BG000_004126 [Podila horticola]
MSLSLLSALPVELRLHILRHLSPPDLAHCVLVNKAHNTLCTPHLWRVIAISDQETFHKLNTPEAQVALSRNAHCIQEFETSFLGAIKWIVTSNQSPTGVAPPEEVPRLSSICQKLTRLHLISEFEIHDPQLLAPFMAPSGSASGTMGKFDSLGTFKTAQAPYIGTA